ncbi:hypothetical protein J2848_004178 [Azospirillum lipoferum]|uniref:hypothetical protein n=1 Tax=Azospirillum TaxID=191 RepID=UPI001478CFB1|nr:MULTISPECIES: hypothetical protein [Azospirillum]MCP1612487.1 hypothetical protein [Azospirillum lipoferum]MDW5531730.1 hypothetical protein [Azospirillum sp. NL1]
MNESFEWLEKATAKAIATMDANAPEIFLAIDRFARLNIVSSSPNPYAKSALVVLHLVIVETEENKLQLVFSVEGFVKYSERKIKE